MEAAHDPSAAAVRDPVVLHSSEFWPGVPVGPKGMRPAEKVAGELWRAGKLVRAVQVGEERGTDEREREIPMLASRVEAEEPQ